MKRWLLQLVFGLELGLAARAVVPPHPSGGLLRTGLLSLIGALAGGAMAEAVLPAELLGKGGLVLAGLGTIAALLIQALASG